MPTIHDRSDVARILDDPSWRVPEAAPGPTPFERLRSEASRFANGPAHDERRASLEARLAELDPARLALDAGARAREALAAGGDPAEIARRIPVRTLAVALDAADPMTAPDDAATLAAPYATGILGDADEALVDAAADRLLGAPPSECAAALEAQLLVQAHAATGGLIVAVLRRAAQSPDAATADLIGAVLRDTPPVTVTRRVAPPLDHKENADDSADRLVELRLDGPDRDATGAAPPRVLAFGAGARRCPASAHAVAITAAVVDVLRERAC
ncbi:hypothetical protein [Agromyces lapidis]|uniref:Cytochrome P450 n=1 Tax=Agromyces lapidis TaxID=279574 RepID=A0ABV5SUR9_9MICO|nr:hypothetical protein [Agromyces lapidis]